jgi:hypothetical protein
MRIFNSIGEWFKLSVHDSWRWIMSLNTQEWFLLLGIAAAAGFCCMRGHGSRGSY